MAKHIFFRILYYLGILNLFRLISRNKAIILLYHGVVKNPIKGPIRNSAYSHIDVHNFRHHMQYLKEKYNIITLEHLCEIINSAGKIPDYAIVITFDDGYRNIFENAYPVLCNYSITSSVFLTSRLVNNDDWLWVDKLEYMVDIAMVESVDILGKSFRLLSKLAKRIFLNFMRHKLKRMNEEKRNKVIQELIKKLNVTIPEHPSEEYRLMNYSEVSQMDNGLVAFGVHTPEHTILTLENPEKARRLILESKQEISAQLKRDVDLFAYPNGSYNDQIKEILKECGFKCGLTTDYGMNDANTDVFALKRMSISSDDSLIPFIANLSGIRKYTSSLMQLFRKTYT